MPRLIHLFLVVLLGRVYGDLQFGRKQIIDKNISMESTESWIAQKGLKAALSSRLNALAEIISDGAKHLQKNI